MRRPGSLSSFRNFLTENPRIWPRQRLDTLHPFATAGEEADESPGAKLHSLTPVLAFKAYTLVPEPTWTTPFAIAGDANTALHSLTGSLAVCQQLGAFVAKIPDYR